MRAKRRLEVPAGIAGIGPEYALLLARPLDATIEGPQDVGDGDAVFGAAWHEVSDERPIAALTPSYWSPIAPVLRQLIVADAIAEAVARVVAAEAELAAGVVAGRAKTWGPLAAKAVVALRERLGRVPTAAERRAVWDALWRRLNDPV